MPQAEINEAITTFERRAEPAGSNGRTVSSENVTPSHEPKGVTNVRSTGAASAVKYFVAEPTVERADATSVALVVSGHEPVLRSMP